MENLTNLEIMFIGIAGLIMAIAIGIALLQSHSRNIRGCGYQPDPNNAKANPTPPQGGSGLSRF